MIRCCFIRNLQQICQQLFRKNFNVSIVMIIGERAQCMDIFVQEFEFLWKLMKSYLKLLLQVKFCRTKVKINVLLRFEFFAYILGCTIQTLSSKQNCHQNFLSHNSTEDLKMLNFGNFEVPRNCYSDIDDMDKSNCKTTTTQTLQATIPLLRHLWTKGIWENGNKLLQFLVTLIIKVILKKVSWKCRHQHFNYWVLRLHGKTIQLYSATLGLNQEVQPKCRETPTRKKIYTSLDGAKQGDRATKKKPEMCWVEVFLWFCTWGKQNQNNRSGRHQKSRNLFHCARKSQICTKQQIPAWEANIDN